MTDYLEKVRKELRSLDRESLSILLGELTSEISRRDEPAFEDFVT